MKNCSERRCDIKLSQELCDSFCNQMASEMGNFYKYTTIQSYFENLQLKNLAKHFKSQADEEMSHYEKILDYINSRVDGQYHYIEVEQPEIKINSLDDVGRIYLETEQATTESIEDIYGLALESRSFIDLPFISELLSYQVLEERESEEFVKRLTSVSDIIVFDLIMGS